MIAMTDAAYVYGGWLLTGGAIAAYTARIWSKTRRARDAITSPAPTTPDATRAATTGPGRPR